MHTSADPLHTPGLNDGISNDWGEMITTQKKQSSQWNNHHYQPLIVIVTQTAGSPRAFLLAMAVYQQLCCWLMLNGQSLTGTNSGWLKVLLLANDEYEEQLLKSIKHLLNSRGPEPAITNIKWLWLIVNSNWPIFNSSNHFISMTNHC